MNCIVTVERAPPEPIPDPIAYVTLRMTQEQAQAVRGLLDEAQYIPNFLGLFAPLFRAMHEVPELRERTRSLDFFRDAFKRM
jgi:hypothetical protein